MRGLTIDHSTEAPIKNSGYEGCRNTRNLEISLIINKNHKMKYDTNSRIPKD